MKNITKWNDLTSTEQYFLEIFFKGDWSKFDDNCKKQLVNIYNDICEMIGGRRIVTNDVFYFGGAERDGTFCDCELVWDGKTEQFVNDYTQEQIDLFKQANEDFDLQNESFGSFHYAQIADEEGLCFIN